MEGVFTNVNKNVFSLSAPIHPQKPIIKTKPPITRNMNAGSKKIPIEIVLSL